MDATIFPRKKAENPNLKDEPSATRMYIILLSRRHGSILTRIENMAPGELASRFRNEYNLYEEISEVDEWYRSFLASTSKASEEYAVLKELRPIIEDLTRSRPLLLKRILNILLKPGIRTTDLLREHSTIPPRPEQSATFECFRLEQELLREIPKLEEEHTAYRHESQDVQHQNATPDMSPVIRDLERMRPYLLIESLRLFEKLTPMLHEIIGSTQKITGKDANIRFFGEQFKIEW